VIENVGVLAFKMSRIASLVATASRRAVAAQQGALPVRQNAALSGRTLSRPPAASSSHHAAYFSSQESASSSSSSSSSSGGVRGWMEGRKEKVEQANYMEQMERLANMEKLTLEKYQAELKRGTDGWAAKLSFLQTKELKMAQEVANVVESFIEVLGKDATADDLITMDRIQRLTVATASNKSVEDIGIMVSQMQNMDLMQRTLMRRKMDGKPIPPNQESMQQVIQKDALAIMSKTQKTQLKNRQKGMARKFARKRRTP
jgi:hypothetical protein